MVFRSLTIVLAVGVSLLGSSSADAHSRHGTRVHHPLRPHPTTVSHVMQTARGRLPLIAPLRRLPPARRANAVCLALTVYHEARGMAHAGQIAVAQVVENRAGRDDTALCTTVSQRHQFTWAARSARRLTPHEPAAWEHAQTVAAAVMHRRAPDIARGATHFYNRRVVHPAWGRHFRITTAIGPMVFLRPRPRHHT